MIHPDPSADTAEGAADPLTDDLAADGPDLLGRPSRRLLHDPDYRDSVMSSSLRANLPPEWADEERPSRPHRRRDCDAALAAGHTKTSASGRTAYCCCGGRRPLKADGTPDGPWLERNSALATSSTPTP